MIELVPANLRTMDAAREGDEALAETLGVSVVPGWATFRQTIEIGRLDLWMPAAAEHARIVLIGKNEQEIRRFQGNSACTPAPAEGAGKGYGGRMVA